MSTQVQRLSLCLSLAGNRLQVCRTSIPFFVSVKETLLLMMRKLEAKSLAIPLIADMFNCQSLYNILLSNPIVRSCV